MMRTGKRTSKLVLTPPNEVETIERWGGFWVYSDGGVFCRDGPGRGNMVRAMLSVRWWVGVISL